MIAAIYARKSTEQNGVGDEGKSVTRQIEHAKAYAAKKGWTPAEDHVYVDDGVSGAEFVKRPGFLRLINALKPKPSFQVLIMSEESRLGREQIETAYALKQIITAGVRIFYYLEDRERVLESAMDKLLLSVTAFADEMEREKARQRTHDALVRKARAGYVAGGSVYGYDNVEVTIPDPVTGAEAASCRATHERSRGGGHSRHLREGSGRLGHPPDCARSERARRASSSTATGWASSSLGAVDHLRDADSVPLPRRGRLEPQPEAKRLGHQASDRAG
jgi:DNA invertase Pin-like site-specific DNA recombinase